MQAQRIASRPRFSAASRPPPRNTAPRYPPHWRRVPSALLAAALLLGGCDGELARGVLYPDLRVSYRRAILDESYVVTITNAAAKPLFDVAISCQRWDHRYILTRSMRPGDTVEAGWLELPSGFRSGDIVEVTAEGFPRPYTARIP